MALSALTRSSAIFQSIAARNASTQTVEFTTAEVAALSKVYLGASLGGVSLYAYLQSIFTISAKDASIISAQRASPRNSIVSVKITGYEYHSIYTVLISAISAMSAGVSKNSLISTAKSLLGIYNSYSPDYVSVVLEPSDAIVSSNVNIINGQNTFFTINGHAKVYGSFINYTVLDRISGTVLYTNRVAATPTSSMQLSIPALNLSKNNEVEIAISQLILAKSEISADVLHFPIVSHVIYSSSIISKVTSIDGIGNTVSTPTSATASALYGIADSMMLVQGDFSEYLYNGEVLTLAGFSSPNNGNFVLQRFDVMSSFNGNYTLLQFGTNEITSVQQLSNMESRKLQSTTTTLTLDSTNGYITIPLTTISGSQAHASFGPNQALARIATANVTYSSLQATAAYTKNLYE